LNNVEQHAMKKGPATYLFAFLLTAAVFLPGVGWGQTNPSPQLIPYSQNFSTLPHNSSVYSIGWQGWQLSGSPGTSFKTSAPADDRPLIASGTASSTTNNVYNYNGKIGFLNSGTFDLALVLAINTIGQQNITVEYDIMTIRNPYGTGTPAADRINEITLQYRIGTSGAFTNLSGIEYQNNTITQTSGIEPQNSQSRTITLPAICSNQEVVQLRWVSREVSGSGARPSFAVDNISITGNILPTEIFLSQSELTGFGYQNCFPTSKTYYISGQNLEPNREITIDATNTNYELSTDNSNFEELLIIPYSGNNFGPTSIYIRLKDNLPFGFYNNEIITHSGGGADPVELSCSGYSMNYINFEDPAKWIPGSGQLGSYQNDHQYLDGVFSATGGPALRETSGTQDGFPSTIGEYAWRLRDANTVEWTITIASGGVGDFSIAIRRWDASPSPNFDLEYSFNGGGNWIKVATINNSALDDSSDWKNFSGTINSGNDDIMIRLIANGTTERIMVDNFYWNCFTEVVCVTSSFYYRSIAPGPWEDIATWEASEDNNNWVSALCPPDYQSASILINHPVTINQNLFIDRVIIQAGGILQRNDGSHLIALRDGAGDDMVIRNGGVFRVINSSSGINYNQCITYLDNSKILVESGGMIEVQISGGSNYSRFGLEPITRIEYQSNAVFYWNASGTSSLSAADATYFPGVSPETVPVLRVGNSFSMGAGSPTTINGILSVDANRNLTFQRGGTKTFRNGIIGSGTVTQSTGADALFSGPFIINGHNAKLGGTGNMTLNSHGLTLSGEVELISNKTIAGGPVTISGELNAGEHTLSLGGDLIIESGAVFNEGTSNLVFNGPSTQILTLPPPNPHPVRFASLTVNNPAGVTINQDIQVINTLSMQAGNILNEGKTITVGELVDNVGNVVHSSGSIHGKLRRWISSSATDNLIFPVGKQGFEALTTIQYTTPPTFGGALTVEFIEEDMGLPPAPAITIAQTEDCPVFNIAYLSYQGFWKFEPEGFSGGTYDIAFNPKGLEIVNDLCQLTALKRTGNGPWTEAGTHVKPTGTITQPVIKRTGVTSGFSDWGIGGGIDNPLPIELLSFTAKYQDGIVLLNWATGSEINNDYFTLERSRDALNAEIIGFVDGAGNSSRTLHYQFVDRDPLPGISYYRLKQTDYDGSFEYSQWVAVQVDGIGGRLQALAISQPQGLWLRIYTPTGHPLQVQLADIYGRIVHSQELSPGSPGHIETFVPMPQSARSVLLYRITDGLDVVTGKVVR
jgi:hypothetical protein